MPNESNVRQLTDHGAPIYPITDRSLVIGLHESAFATYVMAWDGASTPVPANIPAGVVVTYDGTDHTGTLAASASTAQDLYLVASGSQPGEYDRYITTHTSSTYAWNPVGSTAIVSPVIADDLVTNDPSKALSAKQGKILGEKTTELEHKVDELEDDDLSIYSGEYGYSGFASLGTGINTSAAYYFAQKPKDGRIVGVKYKAKTGITRFSIVKTATPGASPQKITVIADFTNDAADDGKVVFKPLYLTLGADEYLGIRDDFYFGPANGETMYHPGGTQSNYALGFVLVADGVETLATDIDGLIKEIDNSIEIYNTISSGSIDSSGTIQQDTPSRTLYSVYCGNTAKVKVSTGDMYGFYNVPARTGAVAIDGTRHIATLSDTEIVIPNGAIYLVVRSASEPIFSYVGAGLTQRVGTLEGKVGTMETQLQELDELEQEINGERYGYPGYATLGQLTNVTAPYFIAERPASGDISSVDVKVGSGTVRILRVTATQLGGEFTYEIVASYNIPSNLENTVVRIPVNIHLDTDQYIGIQGATTNAWYFGQAEGYVLYRNNGSASDYSAAISIISGGISNRVDELENKVGALDVRFIASDVSMFENIGFCGDSYTAGMIVVSENPTVTAQNTNLCWGKILERTHGVNSFIYALGGVSVVNNKPTNAWYLDDANCLPKLLSESAKNLYVISLGHNDAYISTYTTKTKAEFLTEFDTNFRSIISQIASHAPNAKIILCKQSGPYSRMGWGADINAKIAEIGTALGLPVLDPENDEYLSSSVYESTMVHNHPTFAGYAGIAKAFDRQFSWATVEYFDYFKAYTGL